MYNVITVPLDGSPLAERILPTVEHLATGLSLPVQLVSVVGDDLSLADARAYLNRIGDTLRASAFDVRTETLRGSVAEAIITEAEAQDGALIAMSTHGRSGLQRFLLGSVADKVLHGTNAPLFLYRPGEETSAPTDAGLESIVVPLDGSPLAESVLPHAVSLAKRLRLDMVLVRVTSLAQEYFALSGTGTYGYGQTYTPQVMEAFNAMERDAGIYLDNKAEELSGQGVANLRTVNVRGHPAEVIIDTANESPRACVALTTNGRSGIGRWVLGSVADRVVRHGNVPVLVIRAS